MSARDAVRRVRRSSDQRRWQTRELAELLGVLPRQIYRYRQRGQLTACPSVGGRTEFENKEVLRFLLEDYGPTRKAVRS